MTLDGIPYALHGQKATIFALLFNARGKWVSLDAIMDAIYDPIGDQPLWAVMTTRVQLFNLRQVIAPTRFRIVTGGAKQYRMVRAKPKLAQIGGVEMVTNGHFLPSVPCRSQPQAPSLCAKLPLSLNDTRKLQEGRFDEAQKAG